MKELKNNLDNQFLNEWLESENESLKTIYMEHLIAHLIFTGITPREAFEHIVLSGYFEYCDNDKSELFYELDIFINGRFYDANEGGYYFYQEIENFVNEYFKVKEELGDGKSNRD